MRNKKLTEVLVSYFYHADDYTVVMETLGIFETWYKENPKESNRDCKSYSTIDLSFKIAIG